MTEKLLDRIQIIASGSIVCLRLRGDTLTLLLENPPLLYVSVWDEENDRRLFERISWLAARMLSPADVNNIGHQLDKLRRDDEAAFEQSQREAAA